MKLKLKIPLIVLIILCILIPLAYAGINVYLKYNPPVGDEALIETDPTPPTSGSENLEGELGEKLNEKMD